jgi:hypothetical protein
VSTVTTRPEPVSVTAWGELPAERKLPGCLRVLVAGQAAGGAERAGQSWLACSYTAAYRDQITEHQTAEEAIAAVLASGWARKLGARKGSRVFWSARATRLANRTGAR